ncbi:MAG: hypothetical protein JWR80_10027 [Bradyrhizobium sp.]|nr:hypothetical protein [Bradyrhizobium sp.]
MFRYPTLCDKCDTPTANSENDYGEFVCDNCEQNAAEAAYERHCEDFHDGGCTRFNSLISQQIEAQKLK